MGSLAVSSGVVGIGLAAVSMMQSNNSDVSIEYFNLVLKHLNILYTRMETRFDRLDRNLNHLWREMLHEFEDINDEITRVNRNLELRSGAIDRRLKNVQSRLYRALNSKLSREIFVISALRNSEISDLVEKYDLLKKGTDQLVSKHFEEAAIFISSFSGYHIFNEPFVDAIGSYEKNYRDKLRILQSSSGDICGDNCIIELALEESNLESSLASKFVPINREGWKLAAKAITNVVNAHWDKYGKLLNPEIINDVISSGDIIAQNFEIVYGDEYAYRKILNALVHNYKVSVVELYDALLAEKTKWEEINAHSFDLWRHGGSSILIDQENSREYMGPKLPEFMPWCNPSYNHPVYKQPKDWKTPVDMTQAMQPKHRLGFRLGFLNRLDVCHEIFWESPWSSLGNKKYRYFIDGITDRTIPWGRFFVSLKADNKVILTRVSNQQLKSCRSSNSQADCTKAKLYEMWNSDQFPSYRVFGAEAGGDDFHMLRRFMLSDTSKLKDSSKIKKQPIYAKYLYNECAFVSVKTIEKINKCNDNLAALMSTVENVGKDQSRTYYIIQNFGFPSWSRQEFEVKLTSEILKYLDNTRSTLVANMIHEVKEGNVAEASDKVAYYKKIIERFIAVGMGGEIIPDGIREMFYGSNGLIDKNRLLEMITTSVVNRSDVLPSFQSTINRLNNMTDSQIEFNLDQEIIELSAELEDIYHGQLSHQNGVSYN